RPRTASSSLIDQRVKAAAEILGLSDLLYRKPKVLTAEQKQKVAFGRAISREPKLYLLDDPLSGIEPKVRESLRSILINLQIRMNGTFVYATKNVNEALTMATRLIVLRDGFLQQVDTPENLYEYPANAYVAFIVGSPTVNFVNNASVVKDEEGVSVVSEGVKFLLPQNIVDRFTNLEEYANTDKKVILGIRPEDITLCDGEGISATVAAAETICGVPYAECDGKKLTFTVRAQKAGGENAEVKKGDTVKLLPDLTHAFVFDADTRLTLLARDGGYKKTDCPDADFVPLEYAEEEKLKKKFSLTDADKKKKK
ncbi:MAG: ABC transporter ATP-binding protein, partial [Clostridia bacterium]|nr:ABC transporter ATP-binding protein [Clostridia bacterium]